MRLPSGDHAADVFAERALRDGPLVAAIQRGHSQVTMEGVVHFVGPFQDV
jgi:hypothetical protein